MVYWVVKNRVWSELFGKELFFSLERWNISFSEVRVEKEDYQRFRLVFGNIRTIYWHEGTTSDTLLKAFSEPLMTQECTDNEHSQVGTEK